MLNGLKLLGSTRACYVVYGSYMDSATPSNILTIVFVCIHLIWMVFGCVLIFAGLGIISEKSYTPVKDLHHIFYEPMPQLIFLPQSLGYLGRLGSYVEKLKLSGIFQVPLNCGLQYIFLYAFCCY